MTKLQEDLVFLQYYILGHETEDGILGFTEIRDVKTGKQIFAKDSLDFTDEASNLLEGDIYVGINPRENKSGTAKDISYITCLVFDLDPVRPVDTASTDEQWREALQVAIKISSEIDGSIIVSSGSGAHIYIPITPIKVTESSETIRKLEVFYSDIQKRFSTSTVKVDSIGDLPRVIRIFGSLNEKSNRICGPTDISILQRPIRRIDVNKLLEGIVVEEKPSPSSTLKPAEIIGNGYRNATLAKMAGSMRAKGFKEEAILVALLETNKTQCVPPMPENEVKAIAHSIARYEPNPKLLSSDVKCVDNDYFEGLKLRKPGTMLGFPKLDQMLAGLKPGRLYILAARPTDGKTTFLTQIAANLAKNGNKILFFPTEVGASSIYDKIVSATTGISLRKFQFGNFDNLEIQKLEVAKQGLKDLPIYVVEDFALKLNKIEDKIREIQPNVMILDFLQSMKFEEGDAKELGNAVVSIKSLAGKYQIPIILASQLSRVAEGNKSSLSQLKGTGFLEEQGDDIIFLTTLDKLVYPRKVLLNVMKSKYGENGIVKLDFYSSTCEFKESSNV